MKVSELIKLLAGAPPEATVCFVNFKASGLLRTVEEVEIDEIDEFPQGRHEKHWYVILKAEDEADDEDEE